MSTFLIFILIAAILAIAVVGLFIGVCLLIAWASDVFRGSPVQRGSSEREVRGTGRARPAAPGVAEGRHRHASGVPVAYRRGNR